jgi:hypothetical protein
MLMLFANSSSVMTTAVSFGSESRNLLVHIRQPHEVYSVTYRGHEPELGEEPVPGLPGMRTDYHILSFILLRDGLKKTGQV